MSTAKVKTVDGKRTAVEELNTEVFQASQPEPSGLLHRVIKVCKNVNLFMAGMYTGVGCSGTPHTDHSYDTAEKSKK